MYRCESISELGLANQWIDATKKVHWLLIDLRVAHVCIFAAAMQVIEGAVCIAAAGPRLRVATGHIATQKALRGGVCAPHEGGAEPQGAVHADVTARCDERWEARALLVLRWLCCAPPGHRRRQASRRGWAATTTRRLVATAAALAASIRASTG